MSDKPTRLNPPCKPTLAVFIFVPFEITGPLLFSIIAGAEVEAGGFPDILFNELNRSIGVLVLEIRGLLLKVVNPTELSVTPTPIDRAVVRVV